ncbi:hypothetical protein D3C81_1970420 [compost metagenome]
MEYGVAVVASVYVLDEVGHGDRGFLGVQFDDDVTVIGGQFDLGHAQILAIQGIGKEFAQYRDTHLTHSLPLAIRGSRQFFRIVRRISRQFVGPMLSAARPLRL